MSIENNVLIARIGSNCFEQLALKKFDECLDKTGSNPTIAKLYAKIAGKGEGIVKDCDEAMTCLNIIKDLENG